MLSTTDFSPYTTTSVTEDVMFWIDFPLLISPLVTIFNGFVAWYESMVTFAFTFDGTISTFFKRFPASS